MKHGKTTLLINVQGTEIRIFENNPIKQIPYVQNQS